MCSRRKYQERKNDLKSANDERRNEQSYLDQWEDFVRELIKRTTE